MCGFPERLRDRGLRKTTSPTVGRSAARPIGSVNSVPVAASTDPAGRTAAGVTGADATTGCVGRTAAVQVVTEHSVMAVPRSLTAGGTYKRLPVTGHNRYTARADIITGSIIVTVAALLLVTETVFVIITAT